MKLYNLSTLLFTKLALANDSFDQAMDDIDKQVEQKKFSNIIDMTYHKLEDNVNFQAILSANTANPNRNARKNFSYMMSNYGCHCFPNHKSTIGGKGKPVDELDSVCRSLYRCYRCIDIENPNGECDTDQGGYKYGLEDNNGSKDVNCDIMWNKTPMCKTHQCQCDRQFAESVASLFNDGSTWNFNPDFWLNPKYVKRAEANGDPIFDADTVCSAMVSPPADACCGASFPDKVPYNSGSRECCVAANRPYSMMSEECCDDGTVVEAGKCL